MWQILDSMSPGPECGTLFTISLLLRALPLLASLLRSLVLWGGLWFVPCGAVCHHIISEKVYSFLFSLKFYFLLHITFLPTYFS